MMINFPYLTRDIEEKERQEKRKCHFVLSWKIRKEQVYPCLIYITQSQKFFDADPIHKVLKTPIR